MSKKAYILLGGIVVILILGVATWFLFQDDSAKVTEDTTADTTEEVVVVATGTLAFQQGTVEVKEVGGEYAVIETDTVLRQGDSVKTGDESKAIIEIENGDIIRIGANSEITLSIISDTQIAVLQKSGSVYGRVVKDNTRVFQVINGVVVVEALGTAFDVIDGEAEVDVNVVESTVKVTTDDEEKDVEEGKTATITKENKKVALSDFDETKLENDWYTWNKEKDTEKKVALGVFEKKEEVKEETTETPSEQKITLTASAVSSGISLSWTVEGTASEKGYKVVRSESADPVYPGNEYQYFSNGETRSYTWAIADGKTYHFRVCEYDGEKCLLYSNNVSVKSNEPPTPDPTYTGPSLSVTPAETGVNMWWSDKSGNPGFKYYKVVRSKTNADPKYPDDGYIAVRNKGEEHYADYSAVKNTAYYYRICAVGDEVLCGNVRQVTAINENTVPVAVSLSASVVDETVVLTWTKSSEKDFSAYKVVWSKTDSTPTYPEDGYLKALGQESLTYTDTQADLLTGTHYYSLCVLDSASQVACSNVITVTGGVIQ